MQIEDIDILAESDPDYNDKIGLLEHIATTITSYDRSKCSIAALFNNVYWILTTEFTYVLKKNKTPLIFSSSTNNIFYYASDIDFLLLNKIKSSFESYCALKSKKYILLAEQPKDFRLRYVLFALTTAVQIYSKT